MAKQRHKVKPAFTVLISNGPIEHFCIATIARELESRYVPGFVAFENQADLKRLAAIVPFDLVVIYLGNAGRGTGGNTLRRTIRFLSGLRIVHGRRIIAMQGLELAEWFEGTGVAFLKVPFEFQDFLGLLP